MFYLILLLLAVFSWLMIRENRFLGRSFEWIFSLPRGSFFYKTARHAKLVAILKWPFLLALIGLAVPSPWTFDFILTFIGGLIIGWKDFRRSEPKLLKDTELWEG